MKTNSGQSTFTTEIVLHDQDVPIEVRFTYSYSDVRDPDVTIHSIGNTDTGDEIDFGSLSHDTRGFLVDQARESAVDCQFA